MLGFGNYNMNMMSPFSGSFGNFGSFGGFGNFGGFGGCGFSSIFNGCGGFNYDAAAGWAVGGIMMNAATMLIGRAIQNKQENSPANLEADIDDINSEIDEKLEELGCKTEKEYSSYTIDNEPQYQRAIDTAQKNIDSAKESIGQYDSIIKKFETIENPTTEQIQEKDKAVEAKRNLEDKIKEDGELGKALKDAKEAKQKREQKIADIKGEISQLITERNNLQSDINDSILDKADKNRLRRCSDDEYKNLFDTEGNLKSGHTATKSEVRYAILAYRNASNDKEKADAAKKFKALYESMSIKDRTPFKAAANIINA